MLHSDEFLDDEESENAPPPASTTTINTSSFSTAAFSLKAEVAPSEDTDPYGSSVSNTKNNNNTTYSSPKQHNHQNQDIFRDSSRIPLYPMPYRYQSQQQKPKSLLFPHFTRSSTTAASTNSAATGAYNKGSMDTVSKTTEQHAQTCSSSTSASNYYDQVGMSGPIDSDTLLPVSEKDKGSLVTTTRARRVACQSSSQHSQQQENLESASVSITSPTLLFADDDNEALLFMDDDAEDDDDHRHYQRSSSPASHDNQNTTTHFPGETSPPSSGWISTRSSKSQLFGEDIMSAGTNSRCSFNRSQYAQCDDDLESNPLPQEEQRYSYSPNSDGMENVELEISPKQSHPCKHLSSMDQNETHTPHSLHLPVVDIGGPSPEQPSLRRGIRHFKAPATVSKWVDYAKAATLKEIAPIARTAQKKARELLYKYRGPPPSPRAQKMADLAYLRKAHREKVDKLTNIEHDDHFVFALVLTPQQVYAYWSDLLDFQVEQLGEDAARMIQENTTIVSEYGSAVASEPTFRVETMSSTSSDKTSPVSTSNSDSRGSASHGQSPDHSMERTRTNESLSPLFALDPYNFSTPATGMHRRRNQRSVDSAAVPMTTIATPDTTSTTGRVRTLSLASPYRVSTSAQKSVVPRLSMFERAFDPIAMTPPNHGTYNGHEMNGSLRRANELNSAKTLDATPNTNISTNRRRWGPHSLNGALQTPNCMMSPPIRSLSHGGSSSILVKRSTARQRASTATSMLLEQHDEELDEENSILNIDDPNNLKIEDIPQHVIPRGIAARTNGMLQFLSALRRGIVVRRHRSGMDPVFCKISSKDGGDTIHFDCVESEDAINAFKEQRVRYNRGFGGHIGRSGLAQSWSYLEDNDDESCFNNQNFSVPDFIAAKQFREKMQREQGLKRKVTDAVAKVTRNGYFRANDMVAVHPARHDDPRSNKGELGTSTLRRSKATYSPEYTFSVVCRVVKRFPGATTKDTESFENKWYNGEGSDVQFKYLDFETATEGEYWLIFRGFLLLHRDAAAGRFAAHRTAGIGSHVNRLELEQREQADIEAQNKIHEDEFLEPVTPSLLEKLVVKVRKMDTAFMEGRVAPEAVPPPSDYFLGFRSPGTQIWSRLRQAGLETHRVYNIDTRSVMIKIRCPEDRLMDVAEVLRLKLKTRDGKFASFREDSMDQFCRTSDEAEVPGYSDQTSSLFRSSHRQNIIDFIIGSRIRDSGAELDQTTELGRMINARVPLHVPRKLDKLYTAWCHYWQKENWRGRDGCGLRIELGSTHDCSSKDKNHGKVDLSESDQSFLDEHIPSRMYRFLVGSFFQPLDSIEEYFGEKVAFYFAWLQHLSGHLIVLTCVGLIVFACMLIAEDWDHPVRPYWSLFIMIWSFVVLINWRKRSNFLAYRWGTMDYQEQETTRPQFKGKYVVDEITQEWVVQYPSWKRWLKYLISLPLTLGFTFGSLFVILLFHANRDLHIAQYIEANTIEGAEPFEFSFTVYAIGKSAPVADIPITAEYLKDPDFLLILIGLPSILGLCLPLLNFVLMNVSYVLNDFENYRTHSEYRTNLIVKVFAFRFVCYFATLYYYSFMSIGSESAMKNGIIRVASGVMVYTTVAQWWGLFLQIYFPLLVYKIRMRLRRKRLLNELAAVEMEEEELSSKTLEEQEGEDCKIRQIKLINKRLLLDQAQDEIWLEALRPQHDSFPEYIQAVVQFAYVCGFSVVLPITPAIVLLNYLVLMRFDAYKVCKVRRRPLSEKTGGIGVWEHLLHIVVVISVLTNSWLIGFTHSNFLWIKDQFDTVGQFLFVVAAEHILLLVKYAMQQTSSELSQEVRDAIRREQYQQTKQRNGTLQEKQRRTKFHKVSSFRSCSTASTQRTNNAPKSLRFAHSKDDETFTVAEF